MRPNLDPTMAAALANGTIVPALLAELGFRSGVERVWSGVGPLSWNSKTWSGLGELASMGAITEASAVQAEGTSVTLAGIGLSQLDIPALGVTPPSPPYTPAAGESVAWALAGKWAPTASIFSEGPDVFNGFLGCSGSAMATQTGGSVSITNGSTIETNSEEAGWSDFQIPPEIPPGAIITRVYPVIVASGNPGHGFQQASYNGPGGSGILLAMGGSLVGSNVGGLSDVSLQIFAETSLTGTNSNSMVASFVALAVYYEGSPLSKTTLLYEAMGDIRLGGPAKIWFGLMAEGTQTFLGKPYLIFSGSIDKPQTSLSPQTGGVVKLNLENRMVNLQRASNRKYTAADQHVFFPTDMGFNFVELLQDISLKEGIA